MKPLVHSYSSIKDFENCARKYHQVRILKAFKSGGTEATLYGTDVHLAMENFLMHGTPLPDKYRQFLPYAASVKSAKGVIKCEEKMGIRADFSPCGFFDDGVWFRGIPDVMVINGRVARVGDWKTGKSSRYADPDQLELMAAMIMAHYPEVEEVRGILVFLVAQDVVQKTFHRPQFGEIMSKWAGRAARIDAALKSGVWNPRKGPLCNFCPVSAEACEFKE